MTEKPNPPLRVTLSSGSLSSDEAATPRSEAPVKVAPPRRRRRLFLLKAVEVAAVSAAAVLLERRRSR